MPVVISSDDIKEKLPGYSPKKAEEFHEQSVQLADEMFDKVLTTDKHKNVILMSGGSASGKTEFLSTHLNKTQGIIFEGTMATEKRAISKINKIHKVKKTPIIYAVIPDNLKRAYIAFLHRDRQFSDSHFYRTHSKSRNILLKIATELPKIKIHVIESSYTELQELIFKDILFNNKADLIKYLTRIQLSETDIISQVI